MKFSHLTRIYTENSLVLDQIINIDDDNFHYLKSVMRIRKDEEFRLFNSIDGEFLAKVIEIGRSNLQVRVESFIRSVSKEKKLTLALCIIRPERMMEAIKGAVQLGVTEIVPILSERTQFKAVQHAKINRVIIQSTEQSERFNLPKLLPEITLEEFCKTNNNKQMIVASESETSDNKIKNISGIEEDPIILIGPEGGFSTSDMDIIKSHKNLFLISLGESVLRAETASIVTIACVNMMRD